MKAELRKREDIPFSENYRVEDACDVIKWPDTELTATIESIFPPIPDLTGTIKKLRSKELYLLAFGQAKKAMVNLPPIQPPATASLPPALKATGAALGAIPAKPDNAYHPDAREWAAMNKKGDYAYDHPPERYLTPPENDKPEEEPYEGKLRGETVPLEGMEVRLIDYKKRPVADRLKLRSEFDSTERKKFLQDTANDPEKVKQLKAAGLDDADIALMKKGGVPDPYQVHHKLPLDDGGTNSQDNLVLMQHEPYHKAITNAQKELTAGLEPGGVKSIKWPVPTSFVYPQ